MKKITFLLFVFVLSISCQQDSSIEEMNDTQQKITDLNSKLPNELRGGNNPLYLCDFNHYRSVWTGGFIFEFTDSASWGNFVLIRPVDEFNVRQTGKMYEINPSSGKVILPIYHGYYLTGYGYHFVVEDMQYPDGTLYGNCQSHALFLD